MSFTPKDSDFTFSEAIIIREWSGSKGCISVRIGYVREHPEHNQIVLFKKWPGPNGRTEEYKYYIKGKSDWVAIKNAVESLWPELEDSENLNKAQISAAIQKVSGEVELLELLAQYPGLLSKIPESIDILNLPSGQKDALRKFIATGGEIAEKVINKLADEPVNDINDFIRILDEMRLSTVNQLINHVNYRITFIDKFESAIDNDTTFERRGDQSVHNLLKANMWMLDRNYTVLHDDTTLKNIIYQQFNRSASTSDINPNTRPDFLCMTGRRNGNVINQMVIIEIKRPSISLTMNHMQQLMSYKSILDAHSGATVESFTCYLIGRQKAANFQNIDLSASGYIIKTYTDFVAEARQFYEEYLEILQSEDLAI